MVFTFIKRARKSGKNIENVLKSKHYIYIYIYILVENTGCIIVMNGNISVIINHYTLANSWTT